MRLDRFLADAGFGTRKELRALIKNGAATIDGLAVRDPGAAVPEGAMVALHGRTLARTGFVYYMLNKPAGVICASEDARGDRTVMELLPDDLRMRRGLFPAGRLDRETEGLLLITDDGALAHRILSPGKHVEKVYLALVTGEPGDMETRAFQAGFSLPAVHAAAGEAFVTLPAGLEMLSDADGRLGVETGERLRALRAEHGTVTPTLVTIREGKYHQIRRMFQVFGHRVLYLRRLSMGTLLLDPSLSPGDGRMLTEAEVATLRAGFQGAPHPLLVHGYARTNASETD